MAVVKSRHLTPCEFRVTANIQVVYIHDVKRSVLCAQYISPAITSVLLPAGDTWSNQWSKFRNRFDQSSTHRFQQTVHRLFCITWQSRTGFISLSIYKISTTVGSMFPFPIVYFLNNSLTFRTELDSFCTQLKLLLPDKVLVPMC